MRVPVVAALATLLAVLSSCKATSEVDGAASGDEAITSDSADRRAAFDSMKAALAQEAEATHAIKTVTVTVDAETSPATVASIVPPKNANPNCEAPSPAGQRCIPRAATPAPLQGTFWMRGNPLPDYLLSFSNTQWTKVNGTPYGYLSTFAPGSFAWKEKVAAKGAADESDVKYLPEICRVPKDDPTLAKIARQRSTYDSSLFKRPIAEDFAEMAQQGPNGSGVSDADAAKFIDDVWQAGQLPLDGARSVQLLAGVRVFYEAKFSPDYTQSDVIVFGLFTGIGGTTTTPVQIGIPEEVASFSFAPHMSDKDIFMRKSFIQGVSKTPNYYLLTRIVDGDGQPTPHFKEFLQCAQERSQGRILKVTPAE